MKSPTEEEIVVRLEKIIRDGFNRSLSTLEQVGAIDLEKMKEHYRPGSKFYDIVTERIEYTARYAAPAIRALFSDDSPSA